MSNLIIPNQTPRPQPGMHLAVSQDGPTVVIQITSTTVIDPAGARQIMALLEQAVVAAEEFTLNLQQPQPNGLIHRA